MKEKNYANFGYVLATKHLVENNLKVGYGYRDDPVSDCDSGWRFFAGDETQEYCDNANNIGMYDVRTILWLDPNIEEHLGDLPGSSFYDQYKIKSQDWEVLYV